MSGSGSKARRKQRGRSAAASGRNSRPTASTDAADATDGAEARAPLEPSEAAVEEHRSGRVAGYVAYASTFLFFVGLFIGIAAVRPKARPGARSDDASAQLVDFDESRGTALASAVLGAVAMLGVIVLGAFLLRALRRRRPETPSYVLPAWVGATTVLAISNVLGWFSLADLASTFTDSGTRTEDRADELVDDSTLLSVTQVLQVASAAGFGLTLAFLCRQSRRADLLPSMLEYWGYGVAVCLVLLPFAGQALLVGWVASAGMIAADQWPGGRQAGWGRPQAGAAG